MMMSIAQRSLFFLVGLVFLHGFIVPYVLVPFIADRMFVEPRPSIHAYYVDQETGEATYAGIPEQFSTLDYRSNTPDFAQVLAERTKRPGNLSANQQVQVSLDFDRRYLDYLFDKRSRFGAWRHLRQLQKAPVWSVLLEDLPKDGDSQLHQQRWTSLTEALGTISTLRQVRIEPACNSEYAARAVVVALQNMRQMTHLHLAVCDGRDGHVDPLLVEELAEAFHGLSDLQYLTIDLSRSNTRAIVPAVKDLQSLQELTIFHYFDHVIMTAAESTAVSKFVATVSVPVVSIRDIQFPTEESSRQFCQDVVQSSAESLAISNMDVADADCFVEALSMSASITRFKVSAWRNHGSLSVFLSKLIQQLPTMKWQALDLENLCQEPLVGDVYEDDDACRAIMEPVLPELVRAAAKCTSIVELRLPYAQVSADLDKALVDLVQANNSGSQLRVLALGCPLRPPGESGVAWCYPLFLQALQANDKIRDIFLLYRQPEDWRNYLDPWDGEFRQAVAAVTSRNKAATGISDPLKEDPTTPQ